MWRNAAATMLLCAGDTIQPATAVNKGYKNYYQFNKLLFLPVIFFIFASSSIWGNIICIGIGFESENMTYGVEGQNVVFNYQGLGINALALLGTRIGFFVNMNMALLPINATVNGSSINTDKYRYVLVQDSILGLGFEVPLGEALKMILGFGFHFVISISAEGYSDAAISLSNMFIGAGCLVSIHFQITGDLWGMCSCNVSYAFLDEYDFSNTASGINVGIGMGLSFSIDTAFY